jgi:type IV secretion system protein VirB8
MQASNPRSPLATLPRESVLAAEIRSVSSIGPDTAMVRFSTSRTDPGGIAVDQGTWAAVIKYRFSSADMSAASRLVNPLGFQVLGYTRNAEIAPSLPAPTPAVPGAPPGLIMPAQPTPAAIR